MILLVGIKNYLAEQVTGILRVESYFTWNCIMTIAEQIYALVKSLPQDQASEILNFAEFVCAKYLGANQPIQPVNSLHWTELVDSLAGSWKDDFPTLEDIRAESGQNILRESL